MVTEGKKAPAFTLPDQKGKSVSLKDYRGKKLILYFYPRDNTPGCTVEACSFRDNLGRINEKKAHVVGISTDSVQSHQKFIGRFDLPFTLLSDESKEVVKLYGVWKEKNMYGIKFKGIERSTFIINEKGVVTHIFRKVKVKGHVDELLDVV
jgi:thioredoxin-dependent peroxiredoxin